VVKVEKRAFLCHFKKMAKGINIMLYIVCNRQNILSPVIDFGLLSSIISIYQTDFALNIYFCKNCDDVPKKGSF